MPVSKSLTRTPPEDSVLRRKRAPLYLCGAVALLACLAAVAVIRSQGGFERTPFGDAAQYVGVARALASGQGYVWPVSFWGSAPHLGRLPLWPALLAVSARLLPHASNAMLLRFTGIVVHALNAVLLMLVGFRLWPNRRQIGTLAGAFFAIYPPALALLDAGYSEGAFLLFATGGLYLLLRGWPASLWGSLLLGCSVLARSNILCLPFLMLGGALIYDRSLWRFWRRGLVLSILFFLPAVLWVVRNYAVSGKFPLLTSVEGETLYGGNNPLVADDLRYWGYWVFPDDIPGEVSKKVMAEHMNEAQINAYYAQQGKAFIKSHLREYPRLELGKLIRGFVPVPWVPNGSSFVASFFRLLLYAVLIWALASGVRTDIRFELYVLALFLATLLTTLVFYGTFRFTFCLEPVLMLVAAARLFGAGSARDARVRIT